VGSGYSQTPENAIAATNPHQSAQSVAGTASNHAIHLSAFDDSRINKPAVVIWKIVNARVVTVV
jgi:hypothetical protein